MSFRPFASTFRGTLVFILPATSLAAQTPTVDARQCAERNGAIRGALDALHAKQQNVGLAAVVMLGGRVVQAEYLGFADAEHRVPVTAQTRFGVASVTKAFTGAALLKLYDGGRIDLDAPIQRYVPSFPQKPGGIITPRLLAAHMGGIRHWASERTPELFAQHFDSATAVVRLFSADTLIAPPGTRVSYSSHGYNLIAAAIEGATHQRFPDYVQDVVLRPLGLTNTTFDNPLRLVVNRARRYSFYHPVTYAEDSTLYRVPDWDYSHNMGGGNIIASADDLARFARAVSRGGFFSPRVTAMLRSRTRVGAVESATSFGWFVRETGELPARLHITGSNPGVQTALYVYPDHDLVVVVLSNTWGRDARSAEMVQGLPERLVTLCTGWPRA